MTKHEKQQLETVCRYLNDGFDDLGCGRISFGVASVEQAKVDGPCTRFCVNAFSQK